VGFFLFFPADAGGGGWKLPGVEGVSGGLFDKYPGISIGGYKEYGPVEAIYAQARASDELSFTVGL